MIAACGPEPQLRSDKLLQDTSLITGEPCAPPCWRGITPGETTWNSAIAIITDDPTLKDLQTRADDKTNQIGAAWAPVDGDGCCQMFTQEGDVVTFLVLQTAPEMRLGEVIEAHGEPDYLLGDILSENQGLFTLFYSEVPMLVYAFVAGTTGSLTADSEIVGVGYLTSDLIDLLIHSTEPGLHIWEGYQTYQYYMDGDIEITPSITMTPSD